MVNQLEINILCDSENSGVISFTDIVSGNISLDSGNYTAEGFWGLTGGFQVTIEGYKTVFNTTDFHYLIKATNFLIHSLFWINGKTSDRFDKDDFFPDDVVVRTTGGNLIRLQNHSNLELLFSYTPQRENYIFKRGDRFFEGLPINKQTWFSQCNIALGEFFDILLSVANEDKTNETSKLMMGYYRFWQDVSSG